MMDEFQRKLVTDNTKLAEFLAQKTWKKAPGVQDIEELVSLAYQGLVSAALRYREYGEEHGYSKESIDSAQFFSVFARKRILGHILDHQRSQGRVSRTYWRDYRVLVRAGYSEGVPMPELEDRTGLSRTRIRETIRLVENYPVSINDEGTGLEINSDHNVEASVLVQSVMNHALVEELQKLDPLCQIVVTFKYYVGMGLAEIADFLDESVPTVREAHMSAILHLRESMLHRVQDERH